jgi:hypothetical protein
MAKPVKTPRAKRFPWLPLLLLVMAYGSFGWFLASTVGSTELAQIVAELPLPALLAWLATKPNFARMILLLALGWIWVLTTALMSPLTSFSRFVSRWFKSDTVAFLSICLMAGLASVFLLWLNIFLYIITIVASESLARIDLQTAGYAEWQTFWVLAVFSIIGLGIGWEARSWLPHFLQPSTGVVLSLLRVSYCG